MSRSNAWILLVTGLGFGMVTEASAADEARLLLEATRVPSALGISFIDAKTVRFNVGPPGRQGELLDGATFASHGGISLLVRNYHPLLLEVTAKEEKVDEPTLAGSTEFADALIATLKVVPGIGGLGGAVPGAAAPPGVADACDDSYLTCAGAARALATVAAQTAELTACKRLREACSTCARHEAEIRAGAGASAALSGAGLDQATRDAWAAQAVGSAGVTAVKGLVDQKQQSLTRNLVIVDSARAARIAAANLGILGQCPLGSRTTAALDLLDATAAEVEKRRVLAENLLALSKRLELWAAPSLWSPDDPTAYVLLSPEAAIEKKNVITVTFVPRTLGDTAALVADKTTTTRQLNLRWQKRFVTEFGAAAVYNDLRYPKYAVKEVDGQKRVVSDGTEASNVNAAATMNLLCNCFDGGPIFPGLQIGVSKAKEYPGLLAGVVLRFAGVRRFSVATGWMVTWYKDLDKLKVDSPVASENDLKADLKSRRSPTAWYLAAQLTF